MPRLHSFRWPAFAGLASGSAAWLLAGSACAPMQTAPGEAVLAVNEVSPGIFVHLGLQEDWAASNGGDVANSSFVVGGRCVAVIDTGGTPALGRALRAAVARATPLPVCYVINTHAHPDHMLGNVAFAPSAGQAFGAQTQFIASTRFAATLSAREPYYRNALQRDFGIALAHQGFVYPTITVAQAQELDLGGRVLSLQAWPTAHTDNDLTVYDRRTRTLVAADLLFVRHLPVLDGNLRGWLCALAALRRFDVATVVPGHGPVSHDWPAALDAQTDYLHGLLRDTRAALRQGLSIQQAVDRIAAPADAHWLLTGRFQRRNVTAAYAELEWEEPDAPATPQPCPPQAGQQTSLEGKPP